MILYNSPAHNEARLSASLVFANTGAGNSTIEFYASDYPSTTALVTVAVLSKPCGTIAAGVAALTQDAAEGDLVTSTGTVLWGRWKNGSSQIVIDADVSDNTGTGFFKIAGTSGTLLYAGGSLLLGTTAIG